MNRREVLVGSAAAAVTPYLPIIVADWRSAGMPFMAPLRAATEAFLADIGTIYVKEHVGIVERAGIFCANIREGMRKLESDVGDYSIYEYMMLINAIGGYCGVFCIYAQEGSERRRLGDEVERISQEMWTRLARAHCVSNGFPTDWLDEE